MPQITFSGKVQLWCGWAKEQKRKGEGYTNKYLLRCFVSWVLSPHSAVWESQTGGRMEGQPQPPLTCNGIPCLALGQDTAQPCRCVHETGPCTCGFHMELKPSELPKGSAGGTCSGMQQREVRIHTSPLRDHSPCRCTLSIFLAENNLLRFTLT